MDGQQLGRDHFVFRFGGRPFGLRKGERVIYVIPEDSITEPFRFGFEAAIYNEFRNKYQTEEWQNDYPYPSGARRDFHIGMTAGRKAARRMRQVERMERIKSRIKRKRELRLRRNS